MESTSRLCDLISGHLLPYLDPKPARLTKETERALLLSLTMVRREIQQWMTKSRSEPEDMGGGSYLNHCCQDSLLQTFVGAHRCLCNIISAMVAFLNADSPFVRHAAGNILLSISHFLIKHERLWAQLLQLIWFILGDAMSTIFSFPDLSSPAVIHVDDCLVLHERTSGVITDQNLQSARFPAPLKSWLLNVNQFMAVHLFQTLRNILKSLKHDSNDLEEVFIQYAVSSLIKMPWDLLVEIFNCGCTSQISFRQVDESDIRSSLTGVKDLLLGAILQLCCSIVEPNDFEADGNSPFKELSVYLKFSDLVPKLLSCCFVYQLGNGREYLFEYLRHKSLIMMIRFSFHSHWKNSHPESWLKFLNQFFGEILHWSFSGCDAGSEICLQESPFFASSLEGDKSYTRHLQRLAIFLLFKCSFTMACAVETSKKCSCREETTFGLQLCRKQCHLDLLETFTWLQRCCPLDNFQNCRNYYESCSSFATSFLQLYMEELHYDHLVLVDYLISKDTGLHCLQYLLRCLHLICNSWPAFMQFSNFEKKSDNHHQKRRKIHRDEDESPTLKSSTTTFRRQILRRNKNFQCAYEVGDSHNFEKAKGCLHSLKISLGELQRKSLFPYNSKPLLKSLDRFLELCITYKSQQI